MVDGIFTGEFKWYILIDDKYKLLRSKSNQEESNIAGQKSDIEVFKQQIEDQEKEIDKKLFEKYFEYQSPSEMLDNLFSLDNLKRNYVAEKISNNFEYLFDKVKELPLNEKFEESKILETVEMILEFHRQEQGKCLKILTPNQMLSRLPISLAQLKARNNSEKLKNEIRQLSYSFQIKKTYKTTL